jgi:lysozyme
MEFVNGIDVSDNNPNVDWRQVHDSGYSFGICKASEGVGVRQDTFEPYMSAVRAAGMTAGAYHFFSWRSHPVEQAQFCLSRYTPRNGDLPPALDLEARHNETGLSSDENVKRAAAFLSAVEPHLAGHRMLLYMSFSFAHDALNGALGFSGHPFWIAAFNKGSEPPIPPGLSARNVVMWQHSDGEIPDGQPPIAGTHGFIDRDRFIGNLDALKAFRLTGLA